MNNTLNTAFESNYESDFENDFNTAIKLSSEKKDYPSLIKLLQSNKIVEKQIAILNLNEIKSNNDAKILVSNLVGQDGKIREAVAFKINELSKTLNYLNFLDDEHLYLTYIQGIMDINGNVCRQIVDFVNILSSNEQFREYICKKLPEMINKIWDQIEELDLSSKQYVVSKRNFQLYWCLEALYNFAKDVDFNQLKVILQNTGGFYDYTIREKAAKILTKLNNPDLNSLKDKLKNDENYYVRRYLSN